MANMTKRFNVLHRNQDVYNSYLLEASAGTGKTFAIENTVVRLLLEEDAQQNAIALSQILVVTFTRAATLELKTRIRNNIESVLYALSDGSEAIPDYLQAYKEKGNAAIERGKQRLEDALYNFDQSQIFTIHGFCSRMLRDHLFDSHILPFEEDSIDDSHLIRIVRDFIRTELREGSYSSAQLKIILKEFGNSFDKLEQALLKLVKNSLDILPSEPFSELYDRFNANMTTHKFTSQGILDDFSIQAPAYEKLCDRSGNIKSNVLDKVKRFAELFNKRRWHHQDFDLLVSDGLFVVDALDPAKRKNAHKNGIHALTYPELLPWLKTKIKPIVDKARNPSFLLANMGHGCQKLLKKFFQEEEKMRFDDLLRSMAKATKNLEFAAKMRNLYRVVIVDEFQDTDPLQWNIFHDLFDPNGPYKGHLYLVGDPKQSIYAFRQADIYTYLNAAHTLGKERHASLDTNFRSQPSLVKALNSLFAKDTCPEMFPLPAMETFLDCHPVQVSPTAKKKSFQDNLGAVHFCTAEEDSMEKAEKEFFFPFFVKEMCRLTNKDNVDFQNIAVLVSDRFQAERLANFLQSQEIPVAMQRSSSLTQSPALNALKDLLHAALYPKQMSSVKRSLSGPFFGWQEHALFSLTDPLMHEKAVSYFSVLHNILKTQSFASFCTFFKNSIRPSEMCTASEWLLSDHATSQVHDDMEQLMLLLIERENDLGDTPEQLLSYLETLASTPLTDEDKLRKFLDPTQNAVQIFTMHMSKGLEFDVVFALGLVSRTKKPSALCPVQKDGLWHMCAVDIESDAYFKHCKEVEAEKMRQLYVSMTRAKYRLYVPVFLDKKGKPTEPGSASPIELYLQRVAPQSTLDQALDIIKTCEQVTCETIVAVEHDIKHSFVPKEIPDLIEPKQIVLPLKRESIFSFTSLAAQREETTNKNFYTSTQMDKKTPHTLPAGADCGILLHEILEKTPFNISYEALFAMMPSYTQGSLFKGWENVIADMVFSALNTPFHTDDNTFSLCEITETDCYREIEFLYPTTQTPIPELENRPGFVKGVIDLIFKKSDRYYVIDWKSNWLGPTAESYSQENLHQAMVQNDYFLQADLYKSALERYLRLIDQRPFPDIFGGTYYVFLRDAKGFFKLN